MGFATRSRLKRTISIEERRIRRVRDAFGRCGYEIIMNKKTTKGSLPKSLAFSRPHLVRLVFNGFQKTESIDLRLAMDLAVPVTLSRFFGDLAPVLR